MLTACLRLGLLLATLVASLHVAAEPRVWTLTDVRVHRFSSYAFSDPPTDPVTGYFVYDDTTRTISNWSVRFPVPFFDFPSFTYVPGNSLTYVFHDPPRQPFLGFSAVMGEPGPDFGVRQLQLVPLGPLDGSNAVVALDTSESRVDYILLGPTTRRSIATGSLTLTPQPPPVVIAQVDEFYHAGLRHYYITADDAEKQALDTGVHPGWQRTGESFKAYAAGSRAGGSINPVCRFYSPPIIDGGDEPDEVGADSHFFSADAGECMAVFRKWWWFWGWPQDNVFQIDLPDQKTGTCPVGTIPVYRLWNQRVDSNHRYTKSEAIRAQMLAAGYLDEGVRMCALQ